MPGAVRQPIAVLSSDAVQMAKPSFEKTALCTLPECMKVVRVSPASVHRRAFVSSDAVAMRLPSGEKFACQIIKKESCE